MKFTRSFLFIIGLINGYLAWSGMGLAPFFFIRANPLSAVENNVRWLSLPLLVFIAIGSTLLIQKKEGLTKGQWLIALAGLNIACVLSLIIADLIHLYFVPDATISNILGHYKRNPAYIPINIFAANILGLFAIAITSFVFFCLETVMERLKPMN